MYNNVGAQPKAQQLPFPPQASSFGDAFTGVGSGLISGGLSAYGERIFGSSSQYVQSNISRYFADPQYYFQVNSDYVRNKLKIVLLPILHRGHWTRVTEPMAGKISYRPPIFDINAPDLYIPMMAFLSYVVLAGFFLGLDGKFNPETVNWVLMKGLTGWFFQVLLLKVSVMSLSNGDTPLLDIVAYSGYAFTGISLALLGKLLWRHSYYVLLLSSCLCTGVFLVKTMRRVLYAEVRSYDSGKHNIVLIGIALAQFPFFVWLGNITVNWLF
ncbi:unnamed protein product [Amaranthus hypochondriacus]